MKTRQAPHHTMSCMHFNHFIRHNHQANRERELLNCKLLQCQKSFGQIILDLTARLQLVSTFWLQKQLRRLTNGAVNGQHHCHNHGHALVFKKKSRIAKVANSPDQIHH